MKVLTHVVEFGGGGAGWDKGVRQRAIYALSEL